MARSVIDMIPIDGGAPEQAPKELEQFYRTNLTRRHSRSWTTQLPTITSLANLITSLGICSSTGEMMNKFLVLMPEVAGGLGPQTVMDRSTHPPVVSKLHYQFDGWMGDEIVESFPCILVTESLSNRLLLEQVVGMEVGDAEVSISDQFLEVCPGVELPRFVWLKATGCAGIDDVAVGPDFRLVVSEKALRVIQATQPRALDVEEFYAHRLS